MTSIRRFYQTVWLTIISDRALGLFAASRVQDYNGVEGRVTLHHMTSGTRTPVLMGEVPDGAHRTLTGWFNMTAIPDGDYAIEGRVKSDSGSETIMSAFAHPDGSEVIEQLLFTISPAVDQSPVRFLGEIVFHVNVDTVGATLRKLVIPRSNVREAHVENGRRAALIPMGHD